MNGTEIANRVKLRFGDSRGTIITNAFILDAINEAQLEIARETNFGHAEDTSFTADDFRPTGTATVNALLFKEVFYDTRPLALIDKETISRMNYWSLPEGIPEAYYVQEFTVKMFPVPLSTDTTACKITYVPYPTVLADLSGSPDIPVSFHDDVSLYVLALAHERNENWRAAEVIMNRFKTNISQRKYETQSQDDTFRVIGPDIMDQDFILGYWQ